MHWPFKDQPNLATYGQLHTDLRRARVASGIILTRPDNRNPKQWKKLPPVLCFPRGFAWPLPSGARLDKDGRFRPSVKTPGQHFRRWFQTPTAMSCPGAAPAMDGVSHDREAEEPRQRSYARWDVDSRCPDAVADTSIVLSISTNHPSRF